MRLLLLIASCFSLVLAGALFSHQQAFSYDVHKHAHMVTLHKTDDHSHLSSAQIQQEVDAASLHCGSKILALIDWVEHRCVAKNQRPPVSDWSFRFGIWSMLDPPPPRIVPQAV